MDGFNVGNQCMEDCIFDNNSRVTPGRKTITAVDGILGDFERVGRVKECFRNTCDVDVIVM